MTALNAAYDNLKSTIPSLSPKEQLALQPKALLTLSQAVRNVKAPPPHAEKDNSEEDAEAEISAAGIEGKKLGALLQDRQKAHAMLRKGKVLMK